jgi:predicted Ser/Thr protein kinase
MGELRASTAGEAGEARIPAVTPLMAPSLVFSRDRLRSCSGVDLPGDVSDADTRLAGPSSDDASSLTRRVDGDREEAAAAAPVTAFASEALPAIIRARLQVRGDARLGRYLVLRVLGEGGMGVVFSAYDEELDRRVAIKVLSTRAAGGTSGRARIRREAQAMARLSHPSVITVHDVGEVDGDVFVAMELVDGETLGAWLARERPKWRRVLEVFAEAGRGLAAAHAAGLVHRDFKPDNVMLGRDGRVRVMDFGLARGSAAEDEPSPGGDAEVARGVDLRLTRSGAVMGTPLYMAPEQHALRRAPLRGPRRGAVAGDPRRRGPGGAGGLAGAGVAAAGARPRPRQRSGGALAGDGAAPGGAR